MEQMMRANIELKVGAVAGGIVDVGDQRYAEKHGLYVLVQNGNSIDIAEKPGEFTAKVW